MIDLTRFIQIGTHSVFVILVFVSLSIQAATNNHDEIIFQQAKQFTLKISTNIKTPFVFDEKASYIGTGFMIDKSRGWIITNAHVAGRSPSIVKGAFYKQKNVKLTKIYVDPLIDIAILKVEQKDIPKNATQAKLDCNGKVNPGYAVGAYGHPWGLNYTATRGIVSGTPYIVRAKWIQTDAPINSGNSGGPLLSMATGQVVGINSASLQKDKTEGLNFALPIKYACKIINLLKEGRDPSPYQLPLLFYKAKDNDSLTVAKVMNSPLHGFKENDVIVSVSGDESKIDNPMELQHVLRDKISQANILIKRNGKEQTIKLTLKRHAKILGAKAIYINGMTIAPAHLFDRGFYQLDNAWIVQDVESGTSAESEGVKVWGIITHINNQLLTSDIDVLKLSQSQKTISLRVQYVNEGNWQFYQYHKFELPNENVKVLTI